MAIIRLVSSPSSRVSSTVDDTEFAALLIAIPAIGVCMCYVFLSLLDINFLKVIQSTHISLQWLFTIQ